MFPEPFQDGVAGFLLANGALSDDGTKLKIRRQLIKNNLVEAIIILPRNLFYTTDVGALCPSQFKDFEGAEDAQINSSPYAFGDLPDNRLLPVRGHSRMNYTVKWAKKTKKHIDIASMAGILRLTPMTPEVIRVSFTKGATIRNQGYLLETGVQPNTPVEFVREFKVH